MKKWYGITHPEIYINYKINNFLYGLWAKWFCPHGWHLFDEYDDVEKHTIICDACGMDILLTKVWKWNPETKKNEEI